MEQNQILKEINQKYPDEVQAKIAAIISFVSTLIGLLLWITYPNPSIVDQGWQYYDVYTTFHGLIPILLVGMLLIGVVAGIDSQRLGETDE